MQQAKPSTSANAVESAQLRHGIMRYALLRYGL
jgi:hypothetical protein